MIMSAYGRGHGPVVPTSPIKTHSSSKILNNRPAASNEDHDLN